jgi:hypothetical protein
MSHAKTLDPGKCYCGHDCTRCVVYVATITDDMDLRRQAQEFYQTMFGYDVPLEKVHCMGGRASAVFYLCQSCPWRQCCKRRQLNACDECSDYPCETLEQYQAKYVNKYLQISDAG